jgi:hypothetical protein
MSLRGYRRDPYNPTTRWPWEEDPLPGACPECAGAGVVLMDYDEEREPATVACQRCQVFCKPCGRYVSKEGHRCMAAPKVSIEQWAQFYKCTLAGVASDTNLQPVPAAEHAAELADAAVASYLKRLTGEVKVKGLNQ